MAANNYGETDELPLKETPPSSPTDAKVKTAFPGFFLNKTKLIIIVVAVVVLFLLVIILAALLGHANSKLDRQGKTNIFITIYLN